MKNIFIWYLAGAVAAIAIGWVGAIIHASGHAPLGIVSLGLGAALGIVLGTIARAMGILCTRTVVATILLAIVAVLAQHAWLYGDFRRQWLKSRVASAAVAMFRSESPPGPREYFANELAGGKAPLWTIDAVLIAAGAVTAVIWFRRRETIVDVAADGQNNEARHE